MATGNFPSQPAELLPQWASDPGASIVTPSLTQRQSGWTQVPGQLYGQVPPFEWENWLDNSTYQWLLWSLNGFTYLQNAGISTWNSSITYSLGSIVQDGSGRLYASTSDGNINNVLTSSFWKAPTFATGNVMGAGVTKALTVSGNYVPSSNIVGIQVIAVSGGGGGGSVHLTSGGSAVAGGGGAGAISIPVFIPRSVLLVLYPNLFSTGIPCVVGSFGVGGSSPNNGGNGGNTFFANGSTIVIGVQGGTGGSVGTADGSGFGGAGGTASYGSFFSTLVPTTAPYGSSGTHEFVNGSQRARGGQGGVCIYGRNPVGAYTSGAGANGLNADGYGAGGSGACAVSNGSDASGGNGAPGIIFITEFTSQ